MQFDTSEALCKYVAESSDGLCLLGFSTGKDSIGALIQAKRYFHDIRLFYLYLVPGLEFVEDSLQYYEQALSTKIIRLPHPSLYRWLNRAVFQAPQNRFVVADMALPEFDHQDIQAVICEDYSLPLDTTYAASGVRQYDSLNRWSAIQKYGPLNPQKKTFYPVFDWKIERLHTEIEQSGLQLPVDYRLFGRSFDGLDYRFLKPIRDYYPGDYKRILEYFPLADLELFKMEHRTTNHA